MSSLALAFIAQRANGQFFLTPNQSEAEAALHHGFVRVIELFPDLDGVVATLEQENRQQAARIKRLETLLIREGVPIEN